ncbi:MAG TPA: hypothetical protein VK858_06650 [Longimicrobiales bacterium]|nr:hypothetical protein [Longimicrobiales bacterium]
MPPITRIGSRLGGPSALLLLLLVVAPGDLEGQAATRPSWAITAGVGNVRGWLGANGEIFLAGGDWSLLAGVGYVPESDVVVEAFAAFGGGARRYFGGDRHAGFAELSYTLVAVEQSGLFFGTEESERLYGPGVGVGYRFTAGGGFHAELGIGVGWAPGDDVVAPIGSLAIGYTRRRDPHP